MSENQRQRQIMDQSLNKTKCNTNEEIQEVIQFLDKRYFNGILTENSIKTIWSNRLTKNFVKVQRADKYNPMEIRLSQKLLKSSPPLALFRVLIPVMSKAYKSITVKIPIFSPKQSKPRIKSNEMSGQSLTVDEKEKLSEIFDECLTNLFCYFDEKHFDCVLTAKGVQIVWGDFPSSFGGLTFLDEDEDIFEIQISDEFKSHSIDQMIEPLLFEMTIVYILLVSNPRDKYFHKKFDQMFGHKLKEINLEEETNLMIGQKWANIEKSAENSTDKKKQIDKESIETIFYDLDDKYFDRILTITGVRIYWTKQFVLSGVTFSIEWGSVVRIVLSEKLVKMNSKELIVDTLLHQMIHAFLFVKRNHSDKYHGSEFTPILNKLNKISDQKISTKHTVLYG